MSSGHAPYDVVVEDDLLPRRPLRWIIGITVVVVVACVMIVKVWLPPNHMISAGGLQGEAPREISMVEQTLIARDTFARRLQTQQAGQIGSYGWVDREKGIVRIPIEKAMQISVERAR